MPKFDEAERGAASAARPGEAKCAAAESAATRQPRAARGVRRVARHLKRSWLPVLALAAGAAHADGDADATRSALTPTGSFFQLGVAEQTSSATAGLTWRWSRQWPLGSGVVSGYWAAAVSGWRYTSADGAGFTNLAQASFTPVVRYTPAGGSADWFIEGGIGATYTNKIYAAQNRAFSTRFNFGDQIAIGSVFGPAREYEFSFRFEHFSNADLKLPNPGQNFIQLRLSRAFR